MIYRIAKDLTIVFSALLALFASCVSLSSGFIRPLHCYNADTTGWGSAGAYTAQASIITRIILLMIIAANLAIIYFLIRHKNSKYVLLAISVSVLILWVVTLLIAIFGIHYIGLGDACH